MCDVPLLSVKYLCQPVGGSAVAPLLKPSLPEKLSNISASFQAFIKFHKCCYSVNSAVEADSI